jgi:hypothetical protein
MGSEFRAFHLLSVLFTKFQRQKIASIPFQCYQRLTRILEVDRKLKEGIAIERIVAERNELSPDALKIVEKVDFVFNEIRRLAEEGKFLNPKEFEDKIQTIIDEIFKFHKIQYNKETDRTNEMGFMISFCYLTVYSYSFWFNAAIDENNIWHGILEENVLNTKAVPRWLRAIGQALVAVGKDIVQFCDSMNEEENTVWGSIKEGAGASAAEIKKI